ncbi:MAG TPA: A/G-specific adenine glycosylase [Polyangiales bacterium]|nr:A/G-specific adenine glycosylase [Polyangiales bacterium]
MVTANAAERLLQHYVDNFRRLPWRAPPGAVPPEPYRVWLSEVMLQQTGVAAVAPRFERFVARWPTIAVLAAARDEDILSEWAGLGYYARARNLSACAREVARRGAFPTSAEELRKLPGIGAYTAAAIAAIAFGELAPAVDTNVERVIARLHGFEQPSRRAVDAAILAILPPGRAGDFTQAMMDLGATICRPKAPACGECPLRGDCAAYASGTPELFPRPKAKRQRPLRFGTAFWTERDGAVWLVRRPPSGLLGGMAALPGSDWTDAKLPCANSLATVRHVFTHFVLELSIVGSEPTGEGWWQPLGSIAEAGLPTLYRKAIEAAVHDRWRVAA